MTGRSKTKPETIHNCIERLICVFSLYMNIEIVLFLLLTSLFICYCIIDLLAAKGLSALPIRQGTSSEMQPSISVIIAARNEEANIGKCLQSIVRQNYPPGRLEIIVVDDRSTDGTAAIVNNYRTAHPCVRLVSITKIESDLPPKKNALNEGIRESRSDILAFTDADCVASEHWLSCIAREFTPDVGIVAGYSPLEQTFPATFLARWADSFLRYLEMKNSVGAAAAFGLGAAYLGTGRNLAYRKTVFNEVGGFEKIKHSISGDDDLFIQLVQKSTRWNLRYMLSTKSYVETTPPHSLRAFINQRKRHFSAGKYYPVRMKIIFALIHLYGGLALLMLIFYPLMGILSFGGKLAIDGALVYRGTTIFGNRQLLRWLVPMEIASILYNLVIGPLGFFGSFSWKELQS